jgi:hypothetical protein
MRATHWMSCLAVTALWACAPERVPEQPRSPPPPNETAGDSGLSWHVASGIVGCPTGTTLAVPGRLRRESPVRAPGAISFVDPTQRNAVLRITVARDGAPLDRVFADWAELHDKIRSESLAAGTVSHVQLHDNRVWIEYRISEHRYALAYVLVRRNGWACGFGALTALDSDESAQPLALLAGLRDVPGLTLIRDEHARPYEDRDWTSTLSALLHVGARLALPGWN